MSLALVFLMLSWGCGRGSFASGPFLQNEGAADGETHLRVPLFEVQCRQARSRRVLLVIVVSIRVFAKFKLYQVIEKK